MTDPRADTIREALILNGYPDEDTVPCPLAALDGLLADAAEQREQIEHVRGVGERLALEECGKKHQAIDRAEAAEARVAALEAHLEMNLAAGVREQKLRDALHARVAALETALRLCVQHGEMRGWEEDDGPPPDLLAARAALAAPAPPEVGLDGPFEMETPAADTWPAEEQETT